MNDLTVNKAATYALWGGAAIGVGALFYFMFAGPKENPARGSKGPKRISGKKALIRKGTSAQFFMKEGRSYSASGAMLHDPSGRWWPKNSVLCGPLSAGSRKALKEELSGQASHYLGSSHRATIKTVNTPSKAHSGWDYLGEVEEIRYTRTGKKRPGRYYHEFSKPGALFTLVKGKGKVRLYKCGRFYRLDLPRGAVLDSRGFCWP